MSSFGSCPILGLAQGPLDLPKAFPSPKDSRPNYAFDELIAGMWQPRTCETGKRRVQLVPRFILEFSAAPCLFKGSARQFGKRKQPDQMEQNPTGV
jgi:hypothetical protein